MCPFFVCLYGDVGLRCGSAGWVVWCCVCGEVGVGGVGVGGGSWD